MCMDKNIEFYVQPLVIVLTAAHCLEKEPGYYMVKQLELYGAELFVWIRTQSFMSNLQ